MRQAGGLSPRPRRLSLTGDINYKDSAVGDIANRHMVAKGEVGWGRKDWEFGISKCKLLYIGLVNNKVLLHSTGNCIQYAMINHNGKENEKEYIYI